MWLPAFLRPSYPQEYLCVTHDACEKLWRYELNGEDVTHRHLFLGYRPLLIAVEGASRSSGIWSSAHRCIGDRSRRSH
jgi:hypothetical protein